MWDELKFKLEQFQQRALDSGDTNTYVVIDEVFGVMNTLEKQEELNEK